MAGDATQGKHPSEQLTSGDVRCRSPVVGVPQRRFSLDVHEQGPGLFLLTGSRTPELGDVIHAPYPRADGYPYEATLLEGVAHIDICPKAGDAILLNVRFLHCVLGWASRPWYRIVYNGFLGQSRDGCDVLRWN